MMTNEAPDPFYEWIDHQEVRELVHRAHDLEPGERLVLLKVLVPRLVQDLGVGGFTGIVEDGEFPLALQLAASVFRQGGDR